MRYDIRGLLALGLLSACNSIGNEGLESATGVALAQAEVNDESVVLGAPYTIGGITYTPQDIPAYDEVGYASQYRADANTANGELFRPKAATAAHKTLPLPSYVEVTALDTGRTILVRVNDRGPMVSDRLIGLSEGASRQLGLAPDAVTRVRVRRVNPPEQEKAVLRQGITAAERIETPAPLLKVLRDKLARQPVSVAQVAAPVPVKAAAKKDERDFVWEVADPAPRKAVVESDGEYVVQVAALSSRSRADALASKLGASVTATDDGRLFRVRFGPYASEAAAQSGLAEARAKGYPQARIYRD